MTQCRGISHTSSALDGERKTPLSCSPYRKYCPKTKMCVCQDVAMNSAALRTLYRAGAVEGGALSIPWPSQIDLKAVTNLKRTRNGSKRFSATPLPHCWRAGGNLSSLFRERQAGREGDKQAVKAEKRECHGAPCSFCCCSFLSGQQHLP